LLAWLILGRASEEGDRGVAIGRGEAFAGPVGISRFHFPVARNERRNCAWTSGSAQRLHIGGRTLHEGVGALVSMPAMSPRIGVVATDRDGQYNSQEYLRRDDVHPHHSITRRSGELIRWRAGFTRLLLLIRALRWVRLRP